MAILQFVKCQISFWSIPEKFLEPLRSQGSVACCILDIPVTEVRLDRPRIVAVIGELVAAGMAQHVGVGFDAQVGVGACALHHAREARCG